MKDPPFLENGFFRIKAPIKNHESEYFLIQRMDSS
jgi:hypothetical protein